MCAKLNRENLAVVRLTKTQFCHLTGLTIISYFTEVGLFKCTDSFSCTELKALIIDEDFLRSRCTIQILRSIGLQMEHLVFKNIA